jgi:hypothetical protein
MPNCNRRNKIVFMETDIRADKADRILTITLHRPDAK